MFWTPGDLPVSTVTTDGILLRLGMTSGRHKEGHKNAKNTGTSQLRFTTGYGQRQLYAPTASLKGTERHSSSSSHNNDRPWIQGHCLADAPNTKNYNPLWEHQHPRRAEFIDFKCNQGSVPEKRNPITGLKCKEGTFCLLKESSTGDLS